ncbi:TPA: HNH endonuclease, partial [Candidatus Scatousia excrementigallinarum]|nr:HNH endonuclease [Candidatus Scatousia excrementigallinarum]
IQYILKKIERYYAGEELKPNSFTIEHVLPESIKTDYVGMIGNLLPLGSKLNEDLANKELGSKLEGYRQSQYTTVKQFVEKYSNCDSWNKELIIQRTKELAKILYDNIIEG